ncbi:beta-lactamase/transpeptidase-like protein [Aspergillus carlsbadensis]|nr:beta-lactamase/transpeptidase-like protein [Aspergillus carlsbadensis]
MAGFLLGPISQPPSGLLSSPNMMAVTANLSASLLEAIHQGHSRYGDFAANSSSISITALCTQNDQDSPFLDFHFSSPFLNQSAGSAETVTKDSLYRIGSISKLFTVYTLLVNYGWQHWDDSITQYLPELQGAAANLDDGTSVTHVDWSQITIGHLASQLSGIGRDYSYGDLANTDISWSEAGLPFLSPEDVPQCGGNASAPPCAREEYFQGLLRRAPVLEPQATPVYSNTAYRMLGYILEALSGTRFDELLRSSVLVPLGLANTATATPRGKGSWVIPNGESGWDQNMGDEIPTGGMHSSSFELAKFGRAILLNAQLSPVDVRRWMKPNSHTSNPSLSVGSPWEIVRTKSRVSHGRTIDLYTKSGSIGQYNSLLITSPDYGIALSILTAGPNNATVVEVASEIVLQSLIPALENQTLYEACESLCGTYESSDRSRNSSLTVSVDTNGFLQVQNWISRGVDFQAVINAYASETGSPPIKSIYLQATNLGEYRPKSHHEGNIGSPRSVAYRAIFERDMKGDLAASQQRIIDTSAPGTWSSVDSPMYGEIAIDEFVIHVDQSGIAFAIEPRVMRETLYRADQ